MVWAATLAVPVALCGCQSVVEEDEPLPIIQLETVRRLELTTGSDGLATSVRLTIRIQPTDPLPLTIVGLRPEGQEGDDAKLQVEVKWKDFVGTSPLSFGRGFTTVLEFGADGMGSRDEPFERTFEVPIDPPDGRVLARRVESWARLYPVEVLIADTSRSGGARMEFPRAYLETWHHVPEATLDELLVATDPLPAAADLFLAAVSSADSDERREAVLVTLVNALPSFPAQRREPLFGALRYLTGESQGLSVYGWQSWMEQRHDDRP